MLHSILRSPEKAIQIIYSPAPQFRIFFLMNLCSLYHFYNINTLQYIYTFYDSACGTLFYDLHILNRLCTTPVQNRDYDPSHPSSMSHSIRVIDTNKRRGIRSDRLLINRGIGIDLRKEYSFLCSLRWEIECTFLFL